MHGQEPTGPSLLAQVLHHVNLRRFRSFAVTGIALILLSALWLYSPVTLDSARTRLHGGSATKDGSSQTQATPEWPTQSIAADVAGRLIPPKIWQIVLPKKRSDDHFAVDPKLLEYTASWLALNTDYTYTLVGQKGANEFVQRRFANEPEIVEAYHKLPNVGMKSDLLRYLILHVEGGVYTDTDTVALKPIDDWVAPDLRQRVRLIVGIEFDRRDGVAWVDIPHWLQFCQWTIAAAPGHPVFEKMAARVLRSIKELSETYGLPVDQLKPTSLEVMNSTGPAAWTDVVFEQLQENDPSLKDLKDLSFMSEPKLYGDVLVLPIDGFGMGQEHSHSTNDGSVPEAALVKHLFRGSWRGD
ncbi:hypothetical protein VTK56DRAFT_5285 [Thermocarpiscus australiensis]